MFVCVRGGNLCLSLRASPRLSISFSVQILNTAQPCGWEREEKKRRRNIKATPLSSYAKSAEYSICKPRLAVQTKRDYIPRLHVLPRPPFPIFPGEKIMRLCCVILPKLHAPDIPASVCA